MTVSGVDSSATEVGREPLGPLEIALYFGLPLFVALAGILTWWSVDRVEARVGDEVRADLVEAGIDPDELAFEVRYRDVSVSGVVPNEFHPDDVASATNGGLLRDVDVGSLVAAPPEPDPPAELGLQELATGPVEIGVVYDGMTLTVTGTVLNEGQHNVVLETLDLLTGRAEIEERLVISRLAPEVDGADARIADLVTAMESMDLAEEWSMRLTDRDLAIEAVVSDPEAAAAVGALDGLLTSTPTTIALTGLDPLGEA